VDIYSFGLVLYELLSLRIPYEDVHPFAVAGLVLKGTKPELPALESMYKPLVQLFEVCTSMEPEHRPNAAEVKRRLAGMV
jgi:serine/threonine protein kinase